MNRKLSANAKVLVIEEQSLAKGYMRYSLEQLGFLNITYINNIPDALRKIHSQYFDLICCAYELKREHDGYFLYDELQSKQVLSPGSAFIFVSSETSKDIIQGVVDLKPDDFLVKPFTVMDLDKRLTKIMKRKDALRTVYHLMNKKQYEEALRETEDFLTQPEKAGFFPQALQIKGELLALCEKHEQAYDFYHTILNVQNFSWAQLGIIESLMHLKNYDEAEKRILRLAFRPDTQLLAYDLLTKLNIKKQDFETALESAVNAAEVSPRNINRRKQAVDLSRITQDYKTHFEETKRIAQFAKYSIHDKPENYLNVARAGIDYALTTDEIESKEIAEQAQGFLQQFVASGKNTADIEDQLTVANARLMFLRNDRDNAMKLINQLEHGDWDDASMEDLLDRAKAFHELGLHSESQAIMEEIEGRCRSKTNDSQLFLHYIKKEKKQRIAIKESPRDLNNTAVQFYQSGNLNEAFTAFRKAFTIMPKNPSIALNLLQTVTSSAQGRKLSEAARTMIKHCVNTIEEGGLNEEQTTRYTKVKSFLAEHSLL